MLSPQAVLNLLPLVLLLECLLDSYEDALFLRYVLLVLSLIWLLRPYPTGKYIDPPTSAEFDRLVQSESKHDWHDLVQRMVPRSDSYVVVGEEEKNGERKPGKMSSYMVIGVGFLGEKLIHTLLLRGEENIIMFDMNPKVGKLFEGDPRVRFVRGDVTKVEDIRAAIMEHHVDTVFSIFAVIKWFERLPHQREISERINVQGTKNVIRVCLECGVSRLIGTSSSAVVQGKGRDCYVNMDEDTPYTTEEDCPHWYALTKAIAEQLILEANGKVGKDGHVLSTACARPCASIFGAKDNILLQLVLDRDYIPVPPNGGKQSLNSIFVDNVVYGHLLVEKGLLKNDDRVKGKAFCIPPERMIRVCDFVSLSCAFKRHFLKKDIKIMWFVPYRLTLGLAHLVDFYHSCQRFHKLSGDLELLTPAAMIHLDEDYSYSYKKAKEVLGYEPIWTVEEGLVKSFHEHKQKKLLPELPPIPHKLTKE